MRPAPPLAGVLLLLALAPAARAQGDALPEPRWPHPDGWRPPAAEADEAAPPPSAPAPAPDEGWEPDPLGVHVSLSAFFLPVIDVTADVDPFEPDDGVLFDADVKTGRGFAARLGFGEGAIDVGLLYLFGDHAEHEAGGRVHTHAGYLELFLGGPLWEGPVALTLGVGLGVGGAAFDFDAGFDDTGGAACEARLAAGLRLLERVELTAGAGYFFWGYPGEKVGHGGFVNAGLVLRFG